MTNADQRPIADRRLPFGKAGEIDNLVFYYRSSGWDRCGRDVSRQLVYYTPSFGLSFVEAVSRKLHTVNPDKLSSCEGHILRYRGRNGHPNTEDPGRDFRKRTGAVSRNRDHIT